ncbi:FecCD family ABC transporter permease, partial [Paenibacillus sp. 598K]|uniref:FecCD family ABC transporter permease n=1 Tax=Paenibacillus sp. 598K TaxID=1117987 RepID=UPI0011CF81C5
LLRNPLASPGTLGITAGAGLGAVTVALLLPSSLAGLMSVSALVGGAIVALAIYLVAYRSGVDPIRLALVGVAIGAFCSAGIDLILLRGSSNLATALVWLAGSLWGRSWGELLGLLPWLVVLLPVTWRLALQLDLMQLGEATAQGLGLRVATIRLLLFCSVIGLAGASVAAAGTIGFVGLICPHIARTLVGTRHRILLPTAALSGAIIVLAADLAGRLLKPPLELPAGLIISAVGAPFFIYVLWRSSRRRQQG